MAESGNAKEQNMFGGRNGSGLILVKDHVDPHWTIPQVPGLKIPLSVMEDVEEFHGVLQQLVRYKVDHETLYHFILEWRRYGLPSELHNHYGPKTGPDFV
jgi:hypothetical protein